MSSSTQASPLTVLQRGVRRGLLCGLLCGLLASLLAAPAAASKIHTASNPEADFDSFETFAWRPSEAADPGVGPDVRAAANEVLESKGLRHVRADDDPDLWLEFAVGTDDMLYSEWRLELGWWNSIWAVPGVRSRVAAGLLMVVSQNGRGEEDVPVWGGRLIMEGNTPDALMVMAGRAGKETKKMMKRYPK